MSDVANLIEEIEAMTEGELRTHWFELPRAGPDPGHAYAHQLVALRRIEQGASSVPPVSGILHYPTGAGKTRVAIELMARALRSNQHHRFLWATARKQLVRQSMIRLAELSTLFPEGTRFTWASGAGEIRELEEDLHVVFMTRNTLSKALKDAGDGRQKSHPWRMHLESRRPLTLIYDECHQLGAEELQRNWTKFYESVVCPPRAWRRPWRTIGLSATPVPTAHSAHRLLGEYIFPRRSDAPVTAHDWPFHVFHRVRNETLVDSGILCPINLHLDKSGEFDIPAELLRGVIKEAHLPPPGPAASNVEVQQYALRFNSGVLGHPRIVAFVAQKIGAAIDVLGKTIVFVPNIEAANRMAAELYERFPGLRGRVAAVHSRMSELRVPGQSEATVHEVLDRFRRLESAPSIMINVDMLTEGFDDPKIRSVVLARLTLSTNRFWQMIGRGTRGPASKGTHDCYVIDPVKLVRVYNYFGGYQPSFVRDDHIEYEDLDSDEGGLEPLEPRVPAVELPPDPSKTPYKLHPDLERIHERVAVALRHFLSGQGLSEAEAIAVAEAATIRIVDGAPAFEPSPDQKFDSVSASAIMLGEIARVEHAASVDLSWFRRQLPMPFTELLLRQQLRKLRAIEAFQLWTVEAFANAELSGEFQRLMTQEAAGRNDTLGAGGPVLAPAAASSVATFEPAEEATIDAALVVAAADATVSTSELDVIAETLRRMFGRAVSEELRQTLATRQVPNVPNASSFNRLKALLSAPQRQLLLLHLAEITAVDGLVTAAEREVLAACAAAMEIPAPVLDAVLGSHQVVMEGNRPQPEIASAPAKTCATCSRQSPASASFCMACGAALATPPVPRECPACRFAAEPEAAYCTSCGTRL